MQDGVLGRHLALSLVMTLSWPKCQGLVNMQRVYVSNLPWDWSWHQIAQAVHDSAGIWPRFVKKHDRKHQSQDVCSCYLHLGAEVDIQQMVQQLQGCYFSHKRCYAEDCAELPTSKPGAMRKSYRKTLNSQCQWHYMEMECPQWA